MNGNNISNISPKQIGCIKAIVRKLKLEPSEKDMVAGFTGGRTDHVSKMLSPEANEMITYLKSQDPEEVSAERMRRRIISMAHECGYRFPGTTKVDMKRLDEWCVTYGYLHKKLNQYSQKELPQLVTQFEGVYKHVLK